MANRNFRIDKGLEVGPNSSGIGTILTTSGESSVGIASVGINTTILRGQFQVGTALTVSENNLNIRGNITGAAFFGNGSGLTNLPEVTTLSGILTAPGAHFRSGATPYTVNTAVLTGGNVILNRGAVPSPSYLLYGANNTNFGIRLNSSGNLSIGYDIGEDSEALDRFTVNPSGNVVIAGTLNGHTLPSGSGGTYALTSQIPAAYTLPPATTSVLGGVKVDGTTIQISDGVISAIASASAQVVVSTGSDTSSFVLFADNNSGSQDVRVNNSLTYNATSGTLRATVFDGQFNGTSVTGTTGSFSGNVTISGALNNHSLPPGSGGTFALLSDITSAGDIALDDLSNVTAPAPSNGQVLSYNGSAWVPSTLTTSTITLTASTDTSSSLVVSDSSGTGTAQSLRTAAGIAVDAVNGVLDVSSGTTGRVSAKIFRSNALGTQTSLSFGYSSANTGIYFPTTTSLAIVGNGDPAAIFDSSQQTNWGNVILTTVGDADASSTTTLRDSNFLILRSKYWNATAGVSSTTNWRIWNDISAVTPTSRIVAQLEIPGLLANTTGLVLDYNVSTTDFTLTVEKFSGNGASLTALNATQLTTGTVPGDRGVTSGSTSSSFVEYNGTTSTAGQFDGGTTAPTATTRLNYNGYLHATRFTGALVGNVTGNADSATLVSTIQDSSTTGTFYIPIVNTNAAGDRQLRINTAGLNSLSFDKATSTINGNITGTAANCSRTLTINGTANLITVTGTNGALDANRSWTINVGSNVDQINVAQTISANKTYSAQVLLTGVNAAAANNTSTNPLIRMDATTGRLYKTTVNTVSSSLRYKENISQLEQSTIDKVLNLNPVKFYYKDGFGLDTSKIQHGLIAEEIVEAGLPELVNFVYPKEDIIEVENEDGTFSEEVRKGAQQIPDGVSYDKLSVYLLGIIKQQQQQIEDLTNRITALEN